MMSRDHRENGDVTPDGTGKGMFFFFSNLFLNFQKHKNIIPPKQVVQAY